MNYEVKIGNYLSLPAKNKEAAINMADQLLGHFEDYSLLNELNNLQTTILSFLSQEEFNALPFENKYIIPDYFINLILKKYCMKICLKGAIK